MKALSCMTTLFVSAVLLAGSLGCKTSTGGDLLVEDVVPSATFNTKADVYRIFGVPNTIRKAGENTDHYYVFRRSGGGGFGVGSAFIGVFFSRTHHTENTLVFRIDPAGKVISMNRMNGTAVLRGSVWPFGS